MSSIRSPLPKHVTSPWFTLTVARSFFLSYIHDGTLINHLFLRYDLEPKSTQLSERLQGNASYSAGEIVRLTPTEHIRFRYVQLCALRRKPIPQARAGYSPILRKQLHACNVAIRPPLPSLCECQGLRGVHLYTRRTNSRPAAANSR